MKSQLELLMQPITGVGASLIPLNQQHFDELYQCGSDPKVWEQHPESNRYQRPMFEKFFAAAIESKSAFAIIDPATNAVVGTTRFYFLSDGEKITYQSFLAEHSVCIGYTFFARSKWGSGMNQAVKALMLQSRGSFLSLQ